MTHFAAGEGDEFVVNEEELGFGLEGEEGGGGHRRCGKGHNGPMVLETSSAEGGGMMCLPCFSALLSDPSSPCHHVSYALSQLSLLSPHLSSFLLPSSSSSAAARSLIVYPLVRALFCDNFTRDDALARDLVHLVTLLSTTTDPSSSSSLLAGDFVARIADRLSSPPGVPAWTHRHAYSLHCLGLLLDSQHTPGPASVIADRLALFSNLVDGLRLPSEEIRGEILFVLYKLSDIRATPWDDADCDRIDGAESSFAEMKVLLLRHSLEALLKTQHDDVRMNCLALLTVLTERGSFANLFANFPSSRKFGEARNLMQTDEPELQIQLVNLFVDAVKGPLLSSDTHVQIRTLDLIFHILSSDTNCERQVQTCIEENIADYVFEILRLSGNRDPLVVSCLKVLTLLATAHEVFRQKLAIGFPSLLSVLHYVAELPLHPAQCQVLHLVWRCIIECPRVISTTQTEEIALILTKIFRSYTSDEACLKSETMILACSTFVEILKSPSAMYMQNLVLMLQEASRNFILSSLPLPHGNSNQLFLYSLYLLKEAHLYSINNISSVNNKLEKSIIETCEVYLLPWLDRAINEGEEEEVVLDVLETFHLVLLKGSNVETQKFAELLISSSWFSLSFRCLGLFPSDDMTLRVYLMLSLVIDRTLGHELGYSIRDAYALLPSDPLDLLFLLGQKSSYDCDLIDCQRAVLLILYVSSLYGESLADDNQVLASLEQYVIVNGSNFSCGMADSVMLTQLVLLYGLVRGTPIGHRTPFSPEAERMIFHLIAEQEWDFLKMAAHPISLKWLFQQDEILAPLLNQILNFCRLYTNNSQIGFHASEIQIMDISIIAELVVTGNNNMTLLLVSLLKQVHEDCREDDVISVVNVIFGILDIHPEASNKFCSQSICDAIQNVCLSTCYSSQIFKICSCLIFKILSSANHGMISEDGQWFAVTVKLLEFLNAKLASFSCDEEGCLVISIFCLILHHSTNHVLREASMAILMNKSLVSAVDTIVQTVCAKGPSLVEQEAGMGECLMFVLLLYFFSLRSLYVNFQEALDWQDLLLSPHDELQQRSVIFIKCHDLCRLVHFGPSLVKLVGSQCLVEVLNRIADQGLSSDELGCSSSYLESMVAVTEGLLFYGDSRVAMNCGICLSMMLRLEKLILPGTRVTDHSKWFRLIVEELVMILAGPCLVSKYLTNQHKAAAHVAAALLSMDKIPRWMKSVFDVSCISGIIENISAGNVSAETVMLLRELLTKKYLNEEQVACLHHLFQVCRKQVYEDTSEDTSAKTSLGRVVGIPDACKLCSMLLDLMLRPSGESSAVQTERSRLLEEIDMFLKESSTL